MAYVASQDTHTVFPRESRALGSEQACLLTSPDLSSFICAWGCCHLTRKSALDGYTPFHKGPCLGLAHRNYPIQETQLLLLLLLVIIPAQKIKTEVQKFYTRT